MPARGSRKLQAAIDDALAELQRREHAQASLTATRCTAVASRSPSVPRKRARVFKATLPLTGKDDACTYGAQQSGADVLELLQQAAVEVERKETDLHKSEHKNIRDPGADRCEMMVPRRGHNQGPCRCNTPPLAHAIAITDLVQLSMATSFHTELATQISTPSSFALCKQRPVQPVVVQLEQPHPTSAFCPFLAKNASLVHLPSSADRYAQRYLVTPRMQPADLVHTYMLRTQDLGAYR